MKINEEYLRLIIREEIVKTMLEKKVYQRKYKGKTYKAPASMKDDDTWEEKVRSAEKWSDDPEAAAQAASIVFKGKPSGKDKK